MRPRTASQAYLYDLFRRGRGPAVMRLGRRRVISAEAASAWRRTMTEHGDLGETAAAEADRAPDGAREAR